MSVGRFFYLCRCHIGNRVMQTASSVPPSTPALMRPLGVLLLLVAASLPSAEAWRGHERLGLTRSTDYITTTDVGRNRAFSSRVTPPLRSICSNENHADASSVGACVRLTDAEQQQRKAAPLRFAIAAESCERPSGPGRGGNPLWTFDLERVPTTSARAYASELTPDDNNEGGSDGKSADDGDNDDGGARPRRARGAMNALAALMGDGAWDVVIDARSPSEFEKVTRWRWRCDAVVWQQWRSNAFRSDKKRHCGQRWRRGLGGCSEEAWLNCLCRFSLFYLFTLRFLTLFSHPLSYSAHTPGSSFTLLRATDVVSRRRVSPSPSFSCPQGHGSRRDQPTIA